MGRVADLAVHGDHVGPGGQRQQGVAVGLAGGDLVAQLVGGGLDLGRPIVLGGRLAVLGASGLDRQVALAAQLLDGGRGQVGGHRLAVPALLVLDLPHALALDRAGDDHGRPPERFAGLAQGAVDLLQVVAVDLDRPAAERLDPGPISVQVPLELGRPALTQPVDVEDRGQVRELVVGGLVQAFPDRAFGQLGVAAQHPDVVGQLVEVLAGQRHADRDRQPLAERAGGDVDPGQGRGRMALDPGAELAEGEHLLVADRARGLEERVDEG